MDNLVKSLKVWLKKSENSSAILAVALGYKDSAAIRQWIRRDRVPSYQRDRVLKIIRGAK